MSARKKPARRRNERPVDSEIKRAAARAGIPLPSTAEEALSPLADAAFAHQVRAVNAYETLVVALANAAPPNEPDGIVGEAIEIALAEVEMMWTVLNGRDQRAEAMQMVAIEGRLKALREFIAAHIELTWKPGHGPLLEGGAP